MKAFCKYSETLADYNSLHILRRFILITDISEYQLGSVNFSWEVQIIVFIATSFARRPCQATEQILCDTGVL